MKRRRFILYGANAFVFTLIILGILVALNYWAFKRDDRFDVTQEKLHSLSDQTIKGLKGLDKDVEVLAFFKEVGPDRKEFQDLINGYIRRTERIKVRFVDPDKEPGVAKKYEVNEYGTVVLKSGDRDAKVRLADPVSGGIVDNAEEEITNAIIKLSTNIKETVYFLTGHGERDIQDDRESEGFGRLKQALEDGSYEVKKLVLLKELSIPKENSILVVADPKKSLAQKEIEVIRKYIDDGGKAVFMIEPRSGEDLASLLRDYGFDIENDIIIDPSSKLAGGGDVAPMVAEYPPHEITSEFKFATLFPYSRSVDVIKNDNDRTAVIAKTSQYSWGETNFPLFDQGTAEKDPADKPGPLGIAAVSDVGSKTKIAVFGNVNFVSNRFFDFSGNSDFFLNTITWLTGDEHLISIRPKSAKESNLSLTGKQMRIIFSVTVVFIPAIVLFSGIGVWWKRRHM
jgi:gliding motility-associatede transport system auxiliary component